MVLGVLGEEWGSRVLRVSMYLQQEVSIAATQARRTQPRTRRSSKWETSGRLGIFMPQISGNENVGIKTKHDKELVRNNKKIQPRDTCATRHVCDTCWMSNADNRLTPSTATTKRAQAATTTTKTNIIIFILIKKWRQVVLLWFPSQVWHWQLNRVKRAIRKRRFLHSWMTISNFTDTDTWDSISLMQTSKGLKTSQIHSFLTNDGPPLVELMKVLRVQNILKSYDTNQDYKIAMNCLAWKQQTRAVQFLW